MGWALTLFIIICFLASVIDTTRMYFETGEEQEHEEYLTGEDEVPDERQEYREIPANWDTSMIQTVSWDVATREVIEIVWKEDIQL